MVTNLWANREKLRLKKNICFFFLIENLRKGKKQINLDKWFVMRKYSSQIDRGLLLAV